VTESNRTEWDRDYSSIGLIANPFFTTRRREGESVGVGLAIQAAANSLVAALEVSAQSGSARPIWIEKSRLIPDSYHLAAVAQAEKRLINDEVLGIVHGYIQLYMLKLGRIRSALQIFSERLAMRGFDKTLAAWVEEILAAPDAEIDGFDAAEPFLAEFGDAFHADPVAALADVFGECVTERDLKAMEIADVRTVVQSQDIEDEVDDTPEDEGEQGLPPMVDSAEATGREAALIDYIVEYTRVHLSRVIGRAIRVYGIRGTAALASEFTITRAPRKTFKSLCVLATKRFNRVALIYDGFTNWHTVPEDLRDRFVTSLTELRLAMKHSGNLVFIAATDEIVEVEEQFRSDNAIVWSFPSLAVLEADPDALDTEVIRAWIESAALEPGVAEKLLPELQDSFSKANGSLEAFVPLAIAAIDEAAGV